MANHNATLGRTITDRHRYWTEKAKELPHHVQTRGKLPRPEDVERLFEFPNFVRVPFMEWGCAFWAFQHEAHALIFKKHYHDVVEDIRAEGQVHG